MAATQGTPFPYLFLIVLLTFSCGLLPGAAASEPHDYHQLKPHGRPVTRRRAVGDILGNGTANGTLLSEAERIVAAAQAEARERNAYLLAHPRRNKYQFLEGEARSGTARIAGDETNLGTGVNSTVAEASVIVTEALTRNGTLQLEKRQQSSFWMAQMKQSGTSPFAPDKQYQVWRDVKSFGARGDGVTDDTAAINRAISSGNRCGMDCGSSTTLYAVVFFPPGTYLVSGSIIQYYFTQFIGDPLDRPIIKVSPAFAGLGVISSDVYIDGGNGAEWYINQNNFYRQIRNLVIDMTSAPLNDGVAGIHWQVAQATSLQNVKIIMSTVPGNNQQGIFMENGSGGWMSDLEFTGGAIGAYVGNQQFTVRNLKFSNQQKFAVHIHWDWGWTWKGLDISNAPVAVLFATGGDKTEVGSAIFTDSKITNCAVGFQLQGRQASAAITMSLFNLKTTNVPTIAKYDGGATLLAGSGGITDVTAWGVGKRYDTTTGDASGAWQDGAAYPRVPKITGSLLKSPADQASGVFERSKPQYENFPYSQFINVRLNPYSAKGDGSTDDTAALNSAFAAAAASDKILWIPAGVYIVTDTVVMPKGTRVVGQAWSQIMGSGANFADASRPRPVVKVANPGDVGIIEIQDLLFTVRGGTAGAVILEWNIHESSPGSAALWDTHIRVGGAKGSGLQTDDCPKLTGAVNPKCMAASMLVHITSKASGYFENAWWWVADHDLDVVAQTQIDIYVARGVLVESTGPVWLYGTASEHCVLYQYQLLDAANVFMGMIQTEAPYYQVAPKAPAPFSAGSSGFREDPKFDDCFLSSKTCAVAWAVRFINSQSIYFYGGGMYSWFSGYSQACLATEDCQDRLFYIQDSADIYLYSVVTKASVEMISPVGGTPVLGRDNKIGYGSIVMAWLGGAGKPGNPKGGTKHRSPSMATVIPFKATTAAPTQTFTISGPVVSDIDWTPNNGNQNEPAGPGSNECLKCDLARLITSTCCGTGGGVSNPLLIMPGVKLPRDFILPGGFVPNQQVPNIRPGQPSGDAFPAGKPLPGDVIVPKMWFFPFPFVIPPGIGLTDVNTPKDEEDSNNGTLFLIPNFWDGPHTVTCNSPCSIVFPPMPTQTTWTPIPVVTSFSAVTTTVILPPQPSASYRVSRTVVPPAPQQTQTIQPKSSKDPMCLEVSIRILNVPINFEICPPPMPGPPVIPVVTVVPVPPGGRPGPVNPGNKPSRDQEREEDDDDDDDDQTCSLPEWDWSGDDWDFPGSGTGSGGSGSSWPGQGGTAGKDMNPGAGVGKPRTVTVTITAAPPPPTTVTSTVWVPAPTTPAATRPPPPPTKIRPDPSTEQLTCWYGGAPTMYNTLMLAMKMFCGSENWGYRPGKAVGQKIGGTGGLERFSFSQPIMGIKVDMEVIGRNGCEFTVEREECRRIMEKAIECNKPGLRYGGYVESNCARWVIDPNYP